MTISASDRALIDAALERIPPEARRVPTGASALVPDYVWDGKKLVCKDAAQAGWWKPRGPMKLDDAARESIRVELAAGARVVDLARKHGVGIATISRVRSEGAQRDPVDRGAVLAALDEGHCYRRVAEICGCSISAVGRIGRAHGRGNGVSQTEVSKAAEALTARIVTLANGLRTLGEIARKVGCSRHSVAVRRDTFGLDIPNGRPGRRKAEAA